MALDCRRDVLLLVHHFGKLGEGYTLISIDVKSAHNSNNVCFSGAPAVHTAEIHDVIVVKVAFTTIINGLESSDMRPVHLPLQVMLQSLHLHVHLDLELEQQSDLTLNREAECEASLAIMARPLGDHRTHI